MHLINCIVFLTTLTAVIMPIKSSLADNVPESNYSTPATLAVGLQHAIEALEHFDPISARRILEAVLENNQNSDSFTTLAALHYLVRSLRDSGDARGALDRAQQALATLERTPAAPQAVRVTALVDLADAFSDNGRFQASVEPRRRALEIAKAATVTDAELMPSVVVDILIGLTNTYREMDAFQDAEKHLREAEEMLEQLRNDPSHPDYDQILAAYYNSLERRADLIADQGPTEKAARLYKKALDGWRKLYPTSRFPNGHPKIALALTNVGWIASERGHDAEMAHHYEEAMRQFERLYSPDRFPTGHSDLASAYNNLGYALRQQERYAEAEVYYERAVAMRERLYPAELFPHGHLELAVNFVNLGEMYLARGEPDRAKPYYEKALSIREHFYDPIRYPKGHSTIFRVLMGLGKISVLVDRSEAALPIYERSVRMARDLDVQSDKSPHYYLAWALHDQGLALARAGRYTQARIALSEADELWSDSGLTTDGYFLVASTKIALAEIEAKTRNFSTSRKLRESASEMYRRLYPTSKYTKGHFNLAAGLARMARVALLEGDFAGAWQLATEASSIRRGLVARFYTDAAMTEALALQPEVAALPGLALSLAAYYQSDPEALYDILFRNKGAVRRAQGVKMQAFAVQQDATTKQIRRRLYEIRSELARILYSAYDEQYASARRDRFRALTQEKEILEHKIAHQIEADIKQRDERASDLHEFVRTLPSGVIFVDVFRYRRVIRVHNETSVDLVEVDAYAAFILGNGAKPVLVDLGRADELDHLVWRLLADVARGEPSHAREELGLRLWSPLRKVMPDNARIVLISPDGQLNRLPWGVLPHTSDRIVLEDYLVALITSPWMLPLQERASSAAKTPTTLLAVGDVDYGAGSASNLTAADPKAVAVATLSGKNSWKPLQYGARELRTIIDMTKATNVSILDGLHADAGSVYAGLQGKSWIHIITHGFYADRRFAIDFGFDRSLFRSAADDNPRTWLAQRNPMLLSGLVMAQANLIPTVDHSGRL